MCIFVIVIINIPVTKQFHIYFSLYSNIKEIRSNLFREGFAEIKEEILVTQTQVRNILTFKYQYISSFKPTSLLGCIINDLFMLQVIHQVNLFTVDQLFYCN